MMMKSFTRFALITAAATLAACASTPEPEPVVEQTAEPAMPAPEPEPTPEIVERTPPPVVVTPDPNRPAPGSIEDFAYQTGGDPRVYFNYDRHDLTQEARDTLRSQAEWLKAYPQYSAVVEGHADERGTREYNIALGAERADSVKAFLVSQGISPTRLTTVSYGKERPIDPRSNEDGWARNRNGFTNLRPVGIG